MTAGLARAGRRLLAPLDAACNRLYGWRYNPLYQSGTIAVALLAVVLATGVYLLFFYKISAPYASIERLNGQVWLGRWIRSLHRYASDATLVAAAVHAVRMFVQERTWGPRALAWVSGGVVVFVVLVCGWTGYVMVWDAQGLALAREGARLLEALPLFAEPIGRAFGGEQPLPAAFFFLNLFLHVALPVGLGVLLWIHVARIARPVLLPPRPLLWTLVVLLTVASVLVPARLGPAADPFRLADRAPYDWFYAFWLPVSRALPAAWVWILGVAGSGLLLLLPWWGAPRGARRPAPSAVDDRLCSGCRQCYLDCPYEAIAMVARPDADPDRSDSIARVDPALCVSCGICAGSCAPMGVGPPGRTGREQLSQVRARPPVPAGAVAVVRCSRGAPAAALPAGTPVLDVDCAGNLHSSVVEYLLRAGAAGVLVATCPPRDCWNREGVTWLEQRLYHDREAELQARVDKRRVRVAHAGAAEGPALRTAFDAFAADLRRLDVPPPEREIRIEAACDPEPAEVEP